METCTIDKAVTARLIGSMGFPAERVEKAVACLFGQQTDGHIDTDACRVLSVKEVQRCLSVSKSGLRRLMVAGKLTPVRLTPRRIGFRIRDIRAFLENTQIVQTPSHS